jgi:hypothetical protein
MDKKPLDLRTSLFNLGAVLIIFWSLVIGFINIVTLYFAGIPLLGFLPGLILIWFGRALIFKKIFFTLLPIPIVMLVTLYLVEINRPTFEIVLIPQDHRGEFYVILMSRAVKTRPMSGGRSGSIEFPKTAP